MVKYLVSQGAKVLAYDPEAMDVAKEFYFKNLDGLSYVSDKYEAIKNADAMVLVTEWKEFRSPDFDEVKGNMKQAVIFDGRNQYDAIEMAQKGIVYFQIGVG